jgi:hypothetical protein
MRFSNGSILFAPIFLQWFFENVLTRNDTNPSGHGQIHKGRRAGGPKGLPKSNGAEKGFPVHALETIALIKGWSSPRSFTSQRLPLGPAESTLIG